MLRPIPTAMSRLLLTLLVLASISITADAKLRRASMRLPAELSHAERWEVEGRHGWKFLERLTFGDYLVHHVDRSLTKGSDLQILFYAGSKRRQTFGFTLSENGEPAWSGAAATNLRRRAVDLGLEIELRNKSGFSARLSPVGNPEAYWTLELSERSERPLSGSLWTGGRSIAVQGTDALARTPLPLGETSGYIFSVNGRPVAAVEVLNKDAVWFAADLEPALRGPIAAATAALLLFEELRPTLPE